LNCLWGALSQKKKTKHTLTASEEFLVNDNNNIESIKRLDNNRYILQLSNNECMYKYNYARLCPFLLSQARYNISCIIEPYKELVINAHTDGFYLSENPDDITTGINIGDLKYKGYCSNYIVKNCNDRIGNFLL
jgi:hypothetical protein